MNIESQIAVDCRSRAKWVHEQTSQGIVLNAKEHESARTLANNAWKWDFDSAAEELSKAIAENQKLSI